MVKIDQEKPLLGHEYSSIYPLRMFLAYFCPLCSFYASQILIMQFLPIMGKIDQEKPLLDYHSFLNRSALEFLLKIFIREPNYANFFA